MTLSIPAKSLVVLIGPSSSGKSTFAARHFRPTEIVSSDACRALVADDPNALDATKAAFDVLHAIVARRLERGLMTVVDATSVSPESRAPLVKLAKDHHLFAVAIVLDIPDAECIARNRARTDRDMGAHVIRGHAAQLRRHVRGLEREGFRYVHRLRSVAEVDAVVVERTPLWTDRAHDPGPFDVIGDVHGCRDELETLLRELGWELSAGERPTARHPEGRKVVFVGDLVDRGPDAAGVLDLAMNLVEDGVALCVNGNHEAKLLKKLNGRDVKLTHGLDATLASLALRPPEFTAKVRTFIEGLLSHYVLDGGRLVVAHAGLPERMHGRSSGAVRTFAMYGDTTGEIDEYGLPVRLDWAAGYRGKATVVYGHVPVPDAAFEYNTLDIDTGCVFGGRLTALRWPEREIVSVPAQREYYAPIRPPERPIPTRTSDVPLAEDVLGRRTIETRLLGRVIVPEANAAAALEAMSRFAADPRWLVHLPPTMSPPATSRRDGLLEHPDEAFAYYEEAGVRTVVCEEKHMGSRALLVVCRTEAAGRARFGASGGGAVLTRTGRRFFEDDVEAAILDRVREGARELWDDLGTDWLLLDAELLPWSAKASGLLRQQYAPVSAAGLAAFAAVDGALSAAASRGLDVAALQSRTGARKSAMEAYDTSWRRYVWPVRSADDLQLAPFHLLASEGAAHVDKPHAWHLDALSRLGGARPTAHRIVDLADSDARTDAIRWWEDLVAGGAEGMVVKPEGFVVRGPKGLLQPAIKCRGPEYLRIIYGPEYALPGNLERLRGRRLAAKRMLALREFALGVEAIERFVRKEPRWRVHECVFGVLALESEPVDPRL